MQDSYFTQFWSSFFGTRQDNQDRFINQWDVNSYQYNNRVLGTKQAVWIDTYQAYKHYIEIPELRTVIDKRAEMMSAAKPKLYNRDGEIVENHWVIDLINQPNPTQSWNDIVYSLSVNDALYSNAFAYCPKRSFGIRNLLVPLPSDKMEVHLSGKKLKQMDKSGLIDAYTLHYDDETLEKLNVNDVIYLMTNDGLNMVNPVSRLDSLKYPLSNLKATYHKRNVLLENIGAIGILTAQNNDLGGAIPMTPEEKRGIQQDWYRRSKDELIITESNVSWQPMSFPTKDLMLFEELTADKLAIIDVFGLNYYIFSQEQGATFSNVRDGIRMAYTNTIIPETETMYKNIGSQIGLEEEGLFLVPDFTHINVLQDDQEKMASTLRVRAEALNKIMDAGVSLTDEEKRELLNL